VCNSLNRLQIPEVSYYTAVSYWWNMEWLPLYQNSLFVWMKDLIQAMPSIEVGAADGDFLNLVQNHIGSQFPVTYNELVDKKRKQFNFNHLWIGDIFHFKNKIPTEYPINLFMIDVIEHLAKPFDLFPLLASKSRIYIVTADGDALFAYNEMLTHIEHSCIISKSGMSIAAKNNDCKIIKYYSTPFGVSITILEKL